MPIEIMTALTVVTFGALGVVLVTSWIIQTWREELNRNRNRDKLKPPRIGTTHASVAADTEPSRAQPYGGISR